VFYRLTTLLKTTKITLQLYCAETYRSLLILIIDVFDYCRNYAQAVLIGLLERCLKMRPDHWLAQTISWLRKAEGCPV